MGLGAARSPMIRGLQLRLKTRCSCSCRQAGQAFKGASGGAGRASERARRPSHGQETADAGALENSEVKLPSPPRSWGEHRAHLRGDRRRRGRRPRPRRAAGPEQPRPGSASSAASSISSCRPPATHGIEGPAPSSHACFFWDRCVIKGSWCLRCHRGHRT